MVKIDTIELPDLIWVDEFDYLPMSSSKDRTLGYNALVWSSKNKFQRNITLQGDENRAWLTRKQVKELEKLAYIPDAVFDLEYNGKKYKVRFRHEDVPIEMYPILPRTNPNDEDYYYGTIRLQQIE